MFAFMQFPRSQPCPWSFSYAYFPVGWASPCPSSASVPGYAERPYPSPQVCSHLAPALLTARSPDVPLELWLEQEQWWPLGWKSDLAIRHIRGGRGVDVSQRGSWCFCFLWVWVGRLSTEKVRNGLSHNLAGPYLLGVGSLVKRRTKCSLSKSEVVGALGASRISHNWMTLLNSRRIYQSPPTLLRLCSPSWPISKKSPFDIIFCPLIGLAPRRGHQNDVTGEVGFQWLKLQMHLLPTVDLFPIYPLAPQTPHGPTPNLLRVPGSSSSSSLQVPRCTGHTALPSGDLVLPLLSTPDNICISFLLEFSHFCEKEVFFNFSKVLRIKLDNACKVLNSVKKRIYFSHQGKDCTIQAILHPPFLF